MTAPTQPSLAAAPTATVSMATSAAATPGAQVQTLVSGLSIPWDVAPTPDGGLLFTERAGATWFRSAAGVAQVVTTDQSDLFVANEAGLMGVTIDPGFAQNRTYYTCQAYRGSGTTPIDIRVIRWTLAADAASATRAGTVVTGLPITSGTHAGCRLRFAADGTLHIGTGDAVTGTNPQNLDSLGGKTLRVWASTGQPPADNPFATSTGDRRFVWTYGHRNVQGMALRPGTNEMWSVEHGPDRDDEVNFLIRGGNYGWDPVPGYNQNVPMTDLTKFPNAIVARWSSGFPTVAPSGGTFLTGSRWGRWEGALAVALLKDQGVRVFSLTPDGRVRGDDTFPQLNTVFGRIRTVQAAPSGNAIYVTTSNGSNDRLMKVVATSTPQAYTSHLDVSPSGVAVVNRGGVLTAFVRGLDGRIYYANQSSAGASWSSFQVMPGGPVASAPAAVTWGGARVDVFARGSNGQLLHAWSTGSTFTSWQNLGGTITSAPAAASLGVNTIDVLARGPSDSVLRLRWDGRRWSGYSDLGGIITAAPAVTGEAATHLLTVTVRGSDGRLCTQVVAMTTGTPAWNCGSGRETWAAPAVSASLGTPASPVLVTRNGDLTPVVSVGGLITAIGGQITGAMGVAERAPGSYTVLGRGTDGALWSYDGRPNHYTWTRAGGKLS